MLRAGVGLSTERNSERAAANAASAALCSAGTDRADLLLVFATTSHGPGFTRITRTAAEVCGTRNVVGCSAAGVLAGEVEVESGAGVAVLALAGNLDARRFFVPVSRGGAAEAASEIAAAAAGDARLVLLFADTYNVDLGPLFGALAARMPGVPVVGGGASEDGSVGEVAVFAGDAASSHAVAGVVLGGEVRSTVGVAQALRRVGPVRRITSAKGNWVVALDGRPALEAFHAVVPGPLLADPRRALAVVLAGVASGDGAFVARHLIGIDEEHGAVAVAAPVEVGEELFFGVRDPLAAREDLQRVLAAQAGAWATPPAAGLYVNCVGRGRRFYGVPGLETAYIRQQLGSLPVAGFFSAAEFASGPGATMLHQYTGILAVLGAAESGKSQTEVGGRRTRWDG
jgi:small ligand-binding sensory domain FIST